MRAIDGDALLVELMDSDLDHLQRDDWKEVIQIVEDAPTIKVEPHWISVTEKLPEKDGRYYVTLENKYVEILYYAVEQTIRHPKGFYYLSEDGRMTWRQTQNPVIAWCELPESFEG